MNVILPLFNYSRRLYETVLHSGILLSECSILQLKCLNENPYSIGQQLALENFESWTKIFINNSNGEFYSGSAAGVRAFEGRYLKQLLSCLFTAELYDWTMFSSIECLKSDSFVYWKGEVLVSDRPLSRLF